MLKHIAFTIGFLVAFVSSSWAEERSPVQVVEALYRAQGQAFAEGWASLLVHQGQARQYFFNDIADVLDGKNLGYDPLYQGQDAKITDLVIELNADYPVLMPLPQVDVEFRNFGRRVRMGFLLHREAADGNAWQISEIHFDEGTLSQLVAAVKANPTDFE